jgi:hypothetical protein
MAAYDSNDPGAGDIVFGNGSQGEIRTALKRCSLPKKVCSPLHYFNTSLIK